MLQVQLRASQIAMEDAERRILALEDEIEKLGHDIVAKAERIERAEEALDGVITRRSQLLTALTETLDERAEYAELDRRYQQLSEALEGSVS